MPMQYGMIFVGALTVLQIIFFALHFLQEALVILPVTKDFRVAPFPACRINFR
jgi:hypothetical protein